MCRAQLALNPTARELRLAWLLRHGTQRTVDVAGEHHWGALCSRNHTVLTSSPSTPPSRGVFVLESLDERSALLACGLCWVARPLSQINISY